MKVTLTKSLLLLLFLMSLFFSNSLSAQLYMKLQWMPQDEVWGVFAKTDSTVQPSQNVLLGSGQVTVVAPTGFVISNMTSYMGTWVQNARANAPLENEEMDYISFGIRISEPITELGLYEEALILSFATEEGECPPSLHLIENDDPFTTNPNSLNTNPGNDLQMVDLGNGRAIYQYQGNYALDAWNCKEAENVTTSIKDFQRKQLMKVFPNPFKEQLIFELLDPNLSTTLQVQLFDNFGHLIHSQKMDDSSMKIGVKAETALYIYKIIDLETKQILDAGKLIKNK